MAQDPAETYRIWYVKDPMGENKISDVIDNKYYSTKQEAVDARNQYGYGYVSYHEFNDGGYVKTDGSRLMGEIN